MTRSMREFVPITKGEVFMYVCGPTVYNYIHVGNARLTAAFDTIWVAILNTVAMKQPCIPTLRMWDDKHFDNCAGEGITPQEVADKYISPSEDVTALVQPATSSIPVVEFIDIIRLYL